MSKTLIITHARTQTSPSLAHLVTAAKSLNQPCDILVLSGQTVIIPAYADVADVYTATDASFADGVAESLSDTALAHIKSIGYSHVFMAADTMGKTLLPRLAALSDMQALSDVMQILSATTFIRPIYAGNALATVECAEKIVFATIRPTNFDKAAANGNAAPKTISAVVAPNAPKLISRDETKSERPELTAARIVVSGGRGVGSAENFKIIEQLADKMGAAVGASRAAVDSGYIGNDHQVGQTGKIVAPDLYIAVGLSGAIQHMAGMKDSKVIVAINKDPDAPIMHVADYALEADLFTAIPDIIAKL